MIAPYLDASDIIYLVEGFPVAQSLVAQRVTAAEPCGVAVDADLEAGAAVLCLVEGEVGFTMREVRPGRSLAPLA